MDKIGAVCRDAVLTVTVENLLTNGQVHTPKFLMLSGKKKRYFTPNTFFLNRKVIIFKSII